jgi:rRNA maturation protein Nop10
MPISRRTWTVETCDESGKKRRSEGPSRFTRDPFSKKSVEQSNRRENESRKEGKEAKLETQAIRSLGNDSRLLK